MERRIINNTICCICILSAAAFEIYVAHVFGNNGFWNEEDYLIARVIKMFTSAAWIGSLLLYCAVLHICMKYLWTERTPVHPAHGDEYANAVILTGIKGCTVCKLGPPLVKVMDVASRPLCDHCIFKMHNILVDGVKY